MKRVLLLLLILIPVKIHALEVSDVSLISCDDSSNIWISVDGKVERMGLLAYDHLDGSLNNEIEKYICSKIENASLLQVEYDENALEKDKYNRLNVWIWVDGILLQDDLLKKGYGQVNYVLNDYKYLKDLCQIQKKAIEKGIGIWLYDDIEEYYCQSGIDLQNRDSNNAKEEAKRKLTNDLELKRVVMLNSFIIIVILLIRGCEIICRKKN